MKQNTLDASLMEENIVIRRTVMFDAMYDHTSIPFLHFEINVPKTCIAKHM